MRALLVVFLAALPGCKEPCELGESVCYDDHIMACGGETNDEFRDYVPGCGSDKCLDIVDDEGLRHAVCSATDEPDPRCASQTGRFCIDDTTILTCELGFSSREHTCAGLCVTERGSTFCSVDPQSSPHCGSGITAACEPGAVLACREGWVTDRIECDAGFACIRSPRTPVANDPRAFCASSETCTGDSARCTSATTIEGCIAGRKIAMTCNPGSQCEQYGFVGSDVVEAECVFR